MFNIKKIIIIFVSIASNLTVINTVKAADNSNVNSIEESLSIATLLSNSKVFKLGFENYDLQVADSTFGNSETTSYKNGLDVISVPITWELEPISSDWEHAVTAKVYYVSSEGTNQVVSGITDQFKDKTFGLYGNYSQYFPLTENWYLESALGAHLAFYRNNYNYGEGVSTAAREKYNGAVFNVTSFVAMIEPEVGFGYKQEEAWGMWRAYNNTNYVYGQGLGGSVDHPFDINPQAWYIANGIEFKINAPNIWGVGDFFSVGVKRVDVYGDLDVFSEQNYYYEATFGWVIDTRDTIPLLDNVGFGVSINYGSSVSGGSLILYFNE